MKLFACLYRQSDRMRCFLSIFFISATIVVQAQQVESIYFHLYTDSLKKGTHNYINVDGKMANGSWKPLTSRQIHFTSNYGVFEGNDLVLPDHPKVSSVSITATLKSNEKISKRITIWIKQKEDPPLPDYDEDPRRSRRKRR